MLSVKLQKRLNYYNGLIRCPDCREYFLLHDNVKMDILNTLTHPHCHSPLEIKESSTLRQIIEKYPEFFPLPTKDNLKRKVTHFF